MEAGNGAAAVAALTKIVDDYRMLVWDKPAGRYLALAHLAAGNAQKALDVCQKIIAEDKSAAYSGEVAPAYWQALLKLGKNDQLEGLLKKATSSADRPASAAAFCSSWLLRSRMQFSSRGRMTSGAPTASKRPAT